MLAKSLIAGVLSAVTVGSVVYFGTNPVSQTPNQEETSPNVKMAEVNNAEIVLTPTPQGDSLLDKKPPTPEVAAETPALKPAPKKEKWLDQYLKPSKKSKTADADKETADNEMADKEIVQSETAELETVETETAELETVETETVEIETAELETESHPSDETEKEKAVARKYQELEDTYGSGEVIAEPDVVGDIEVVEPAQSIQEDIIDIPEGPQSVIEVEAKADLIPDPSVTDTLESNDIPVETKDAVHTHDQTEIIAHDQGGVHKLGTVHKEGSVYDCIYDVVFEQIESIEAEDLKNQAYFILANSALEDRVHVIAKKAIANITVTEMKETARINLAVAYGRDGNHEAAFDLVNEVEQGEYRDILRLQVIEALLQPPASVAKP